MLRQFPPKNQRPLEDTYMHDLPIDRKVKKSRPKAYLPRRRFSHGALQPIKAILQEIEEDEKKKKKKNANATFKASGAAVKFKSKNAKGRPKKNKKATGKKKPTYAASTSSCEESHPQQGLAT